jgi:hypothetical protein
MSPNDLPLLRRNGFKKDFIFSQLVKYEALPSFCHSDMAASGARIKRGRGKSGSGAGG